MFVKQVFDVCLASIGLLVLAPLFLAIAIWIKFDSKGPIMFRQQRVGQFERGFSIYKFRTMFTRSDESDSQLTIGADTRITRAGSFLRQYKLDELPQLINVIMGEMSIVGPRPEVPRYVANYPANIKAIVLSVKPGITDFASIQFRRENEILASALDPEQVYIDNILPVKLEHYVRYVRNRTLWLDIMIIFSTLKLVFD